MTDEKREKRGKITHDCRTSWYGAARRQMTTVNRKPARGCPYRGEGRILRADALPRGGETAGRSGLAVRGKARRIPSDRRSDEEWCRAVVAKQAGFLAPFCEYCTRSRGGAGRHCT